MSFEKFENRIVISAKLVAVSPVFIGARSDSFKPGAINGACVKDANDNPYIPGSSLKGVLRAFLADVKRDPVKSVVNEKFKDKEQRETYASQEELAKAIEEVSTLAEKFFGSQIMAGKVKIEDAVISGGTQLKTEVRNGVAIDRDTRTAVDGALFDSEVVPAGTAFDFRLTAENLGKEEAPLFGELMEYFADGNITVGGRSRAGFGSVRLEDIEVFTYSMEDGGNRLDFPKKCGPVRGKDKMKEAVLSVCQSNK